MKHIRGNTLATLQKSTENGYNAIGNRQNVWTDVITLTGWLDLSNGGSQYTYNAKLQDSTHVFLCDYTPIDRSAENKRIIINGELYDVVLIDDPMEMHQHLEIYLTYIGGMLNG